MAISTQRKVPPRPPRHKPVDRQTLSQNAIPSIAKIRDLIKKVTSALGGTNFAVGDQVIVTTRNPINGQARNDGRVTKLNDNGTINVEIETRNGPVQVVSAKAVETLELDPVWSFP